MATHPGYPVKSAAPCVGIGVVTFITANTAAPTGLTDWGGGAALSVARISAGRFRITFNGPYKLLTGFGNPNAFNTYRVLCGQIDGNTLSVSVLDNLGAEVDTTDIQVDVLYALQL